MLDPPAALLMIVTAPPFFKTPHEMVLVDDVVVPVPLVVFAIPPTVDICAFTVVVADVFKNIPRVIVSESINPVAVPLFVRVNPVVRIRPPTVKAFTGNVTVGVNRKLVGDEGDPIPDT